MTNDRSTLTLSIPERPKFMHFMPVLDILAVVFAFPLLISQFSSAGGHKVVTPTTTTRIPNVEHAAVVEMRGGETLQIWINQEKVELEQLDTRLDTLASEWFYGGDPVVILKADKELKNNELANIRNKLAAKKFSIWIVEELVSSQ